MSVNYTINAFKTNTNPLLKQIKVNYGHKHIFSCTSLNIEHCLIERLQIFNGRSASRPAILRKIQTAPIRAKIRYEKQHVL